MSKGRGANCSSQAGDREDVDRADPLRVPRPGDGQGGERLD